MQPDWLPPELMPWLHTLHPLAFGFWWGGIGVLSTFLIPAATSENGLPESWLYPLIAQYRRWMMAIALVSLVTGGIFLQAAGGMKEAPPALQLKVILSVALLVLVGAMIWGPMANLLKHQQDPYGQAVLVRTSMVWTQWMGWAIVALATTMELIVTGVIRL